MSTVRPFRARSRKTPAPPPPFLLRRAERLTTPLVFASPHSGRWYPDDLLSSSRLDALALRSSEDAHVDALIEAGAAMGAAVLSCNVARAYVDVNREPWDLDPDMFEDALPPYARSQSARVAAGLGVIAKVVGEGREIYARKLTFAEAQDRIAGVHAPYHSALAGLIDEAKARFGAAVLIDWHSMPSAAAKAAARRGRGKPDIVLGDRHGAACSRELANLVRREFEAVGRTVAMNAPYAGGYTTAAYGRPTDGVHALQVEIDRGLYLDEATLTPLSDGFERVKRDVDRLVRALVETDWPRLLAARP
jgi:N-formylglutamate amidohydrolase